MDLIWLIPLLPGIGAAINGLFGIRFFSKRMAGRVDDGRCIRVERECVFTVARHG